MTKTPGAAYSERRRTKLSRLGLCTACGLVPPVGESESCRACLDADRQRYARKVGAVRRVLHCGECGGVGHYARTCDQRREVVTRG